MNDQLLLTLKETKEILDSIHVPFFLTYGTLLGAYRDGDFLPEDGDVDIGIFGLERQRDIENAFTSRGWEIRTCGKRKWRHVPLKKYTPLDILLFTPGDGIYQCWVNSWKAWMSFPMRFGTLGQLRFKGMDFNVPTPTDEFLNHVYIDYKDKTSRRSANTK